MTELSDRKLDLSESRKRNLGIKPAQKRDQEPRGMLGREDIGRTEEDYRHPNNYRHPVSDESTRFHLQTVVAACRPRPNKNVQSAPAVAFVLWRGKRLPLQFLNS